MLIILTLNFTSQFNNLGFVFLVKNLKNQYLIYEIINDFITFLSICRNNSILYY